MFKKKAKEAANANRLSAKEFFTRYWFWLVIMLILLIFGAWAGFVVDDVGKVSKIFKKPEKYISEYLEVKYFLRALLTFLSFEGKAFIGGAAGAIIGFFIFAMAAKPQKRFHRKGVEHGSARWGNDKEKEIIQDTNDFFNNVIVSSDVLLVLDRKQRDLNALSEKERQKREEEKEAKKAAQAERTQRIKNQIAEVLSAADNGDEPIIKDTTLVKAPVGVERITVPNGVVTIGKYAFAESIASIIDLPTSCKEIEEGAFFGCKKLTSINLESVTSIEAAAFEGCENLDDVSFSADLEKIGDGAFEKCERITISCPKGSYAEKYANDNYIFCIIPKEKEENDNKKNFNKKISVKKVMETTQKSQKIKPMLNLNMIILGGSGTGKSRFFVKPNLMQCNTSFVVTDPSGELLQSCGKMLEREGYIVKVFNINDMEHSCNYNPFHYLKGSDGKYDENNVIKMINTFMLNTKGEGEGGDPFWDNATQLLLSAICFLLVETAPEEQQNFAGVLDLIHKAKVIEGKEEEKSDLDLIFDEHREESPDCLSCQYYEEFKQAAGKTMQSILISTTTRLQHFKLEKVRNLTYTDSLHLEEMGDRRTALFIIIPSTDTTYNFLAAMMYTQLFDTLYNRAITKYHGRLPIHVRFLLDEFANVGKIPDFDKVLATCRKFEISAVIILQNLTQLKRIYEKSWEELPGNCDTMIFLGGKDQFTNEYLMKSLGKETIDLVSVNKSKGQSGSTSYNDSILGRELMQLNELETMENSRCIVMIRGLNPFLTDKYEIKNHARYNMLDEAWDYNMGAVNRNQYLIEKEIQTTPEVKIMDLSEWIDDEEIEDFDLDTINVVYVSPDNNEIHTAEEIKAAEELDTSMLDDIAGADILASVTL